LNASARVGVQRARGGSNLKSVRTIGSQKRIGADDVCG
jgi:hypothetical protein